ncbi:hypothetical protein FB446DRAFT_705945 [Lentinula raphanica]|nr:hypothetical protein FB446DRAFT_705945 [Lentinula raphanica]
MAICINLPYIPPLALDPIRIPYPMATPPANSKTQTSWEGWKGQYDEDEDEELKRGFGTCVEFELEFGFEWERSSRGFRVDEDDDNVYSRYKHTMLITHTHVRIFSYDAYNTHDADNNNIQNVQTISAVCVPNTCEEDGGSEGCARAGIFEGPTSSSMSTIGENSVLDKKRKELGGERGSIGGEVGGVAGIKTPLVDVMVEFLGLHQEHHTPSLSLSTPSSSAPASASNPAQSSSHDPFCPFIPSPIYTTLKSKPQFKHMPMNGVHQEDTEAALDVGKGKGKEREDKEYEEDRTEGLEAQADLEDGWVQGMGGIFEDSQAEVNFLMSVYKEKGKETDSKGSSMSLVPPSPPHLRLHLPKKGQALGKSVTVITTMEQKSTEG